MTLVPRPLLEASELLFRRCVKITHGQLRIILALAREIAADIAQIFALERQRIVFGMALEEDESAGILPHEDVDAGLGRARQHLIAGLCQIALGNFVETRM